MKCKVFIERISNLEDAVNKWLEENPNISIVHANITTKDDYVILYRELKEERKEKLLNLNV